MPSSAPYIYCRESLRIILDNFGSDKVEINFKLSIFRYWIKNMVNIFFLDRKTMIQILIIDTVKDDFILLQRLK